MSVQWNVYENFQALLQAGPYHLALESILIIWIVWLFTTKNPKDKKKFKLTPQEEEQLLSEWSPEPLVSSIPDESLPALNPRVVENKIGHRIILNGKEVLNFGSHNYLGLSGNPEIEEASINCLHKYGVGACGPRGFYGTTEVHLELEERLASFYGCELAILYSYGFSTMASAIPAYAKRGDVIFADEKINFALQRGLQASRSRCVYFRHNDVAHLDQLLMEQAKKDKKDSKKALATRRFIVIEGIYLNTGTICPIDKVVALARNHKVRIFMDDSVGFGTIGPNGKGTIDLFDMSYDDIDLLMVSLEYAAAGTGGFCVGTKFVVEHQTLSGLGYCFSAAMPPMLAAASIRVLDILEKDGVDLMLALQDKCEKVHCCFSDISDKFELCGDRRSPVKHFSLKTHFDDRAKEEEILRGIVALCEIEGFAFVVASHIQGPDTPISMPSIRIAVNKDFMDSDIKRGAKVLKFSVDKFFDSSIVPVPSIDASVVSEDMVCDIKARDDDSNGSSDIDSYINKEVQES